jgi:hypothetical protein
MQRFHNLGLIETNREHFLSAAHVRQPKGIPSFLL